LSCVPLLKGVFFGDRYPCRRRGDTPPWVNAWRERSQMTGTGKCDLGGPPRLMGAKAGHMRHKAAFQAVPPREPPTRGQRRPRNSMTLAGICSRSSTCHSWCIFHFSSAYNHCNGSIGVPRLANVLEFRLKPRVSGLLGYLSFPAVPAGNRCPLSWRGLLL
jgi:hypothetical protein